MKLFYRLFRKRIFTDHKGNKYFTYNNKRYVELANARENAVSGTCYAWLNYITNIIDENADIPQTFTRHLYELPQKYVRWIP